MVDSEKISSEMLRRLQPGSYSRAECNALFQNDVIYKNETKHCDYTYDGLLCWPPSRAGSEVKQNCPDIDRLNPFNFAYRRCGLNGEWMEFNGSKNSYSKTHFEECFMPNQSDFTREVSARLSHQDILDIGKNLNILGIVLLVISLLSVLIAMIIYFIVLPKFVNTILHVRIQKHLFASVTIDAVLKLFNHVVIFLQLQTNVPVYLTFICEFLAITLQYSELAIITWLALESHFIQLTSRSGHLCTSGYMTYVIVGWGVPVIPVSVWAVSLVVSHKVKCWTGHTSLPIIWIMETSKLVGFVVVVSLLCISTWRIFGNPKNRRMVDTRKIKYDISMTTIFFVLLLVSILVVLIPKHTLKGLCVPCQYIATVFTSSRGIMVSVLYCFVSHDVHEFIHYSQTVLPTTFT